MTAERSEPGVVVRAERLVAGGAALARRPDGRIVLVDGALPGETVEVEVRVRRGAARGSVVRVLEPSSDRVEPRCTHVADGCGGCDLPALTPGAQVAAKVDLVRDALRRIGTWADPVVRPGPALASWGFRTTLRCAVTAGRAGLRRGASHEVVPLDHCLVAHPLIDELVAEGRFGAATEVVLRVGAATRERLAVVTPTTAGVRVPADVRLVGADDLAAGRRAWIHEVVAGRRWRVSAAAFFQSRPDGAAALLEVVRDLAGDVLTAVPTGPRARVLLDAYSGVGLFSGGLLASRPGWRAVLVEHNRAAAADARVNLTDLDARVVVAPVERLRAPRADLVVADPSRAGLGQRGAAAVAAADASRLVLVSCDPAAAGRDVGILRDLGYEPVEAVVVDLFPHTHHVEVVTRFDAR